MKSFVWRIWLLIILCASFSIANKAQAPNCDLNEAVAGEIAVQLVNAADLTAVTTQYNLNPTPRWQFGSRPIYILGINDSRTVCQVVSTLR